MAEIVGVVASLVDWICIVEPIKRQFNYLCCFNSNIQSLRKEAKKLDDERNGLQLKIDAAEDNDEVILPKVVSWLKSSNEIKVKKNGIETEIPIVKRRFWNIKSRFLLSRKAKKTTEVMKELRGDCKFDPISHPAPPPARGPIQIGETYEFETRKKIEEDIMEDLRGGKVNLLGICGMGGVGKTTMAERIMKRAREEDLFDEILKVIVSQSVNMSKIQEVISESLGLELKEKSLSVRARKLHARLKSAKRTLVVLDDVWEILKLEELGIPSGVKECTILLTSRNRGVFNAMDVKKVFGLEILPEEEAWDFFREKVGACVDGQDLVSIAEKVAKECKGLPLALVIVGRALKDEKSKNIWEDALHQLEGSNLVGIQDCSKEVYKPLKLSYDFLDNEQKSVFLFCSLFAEDVDISLEHLAWYFLGLRKFGRTMNLKATRNRVEALVDQLKKRFLLLVGNDKYHVKMHDVVRDVAIVIASEEKLVDSNFRSIDGWLEHSYSDCIWISMFSQERIELPIVLSVPSLRFLLIRNSKESKNHKFFEAIKELNVLSFIHKSKGREIQMHDKFFEAIKELNVLSFRHLPFRSFPQTMKLLENLRTLDLESCHDLKSISVVGQLLNLQILRCHYCYSITELPAEIGRLIHLRLLDFSYCRNLERVEPGVLSSLVELEELKMIGSFKGWEAKKNGIERRNASLYELQSLSKLTCLEIEIDDCALAAEDIRLSSKIVKYNIRFMDVYVSKTYEKMMCLKLPREISLGDWIHILLRRTEVLELRGDGSVKLDLAQVQDIKRFKFRECSTVNKLISTKSIDCVFPVLKSLKLFSLPNLEEICDGPIEAGSNSFNNLKELDISDLPALMYLWNSQNQNISLSNLTSIHIHCCDKLRNLFPLKMAKDGLLQLKRLEIEECSMMEEVFSNDGEGHITFPKLESVSLRKLPSLTTFSKGIESIECPVLTEMVINDCPKLNLAGHNDDSLHWFCNQKVTFGSLQTLEIQGYENISNLWCHQIPSTGFFNKLEKLEIRGCGGIRSLFTSSIAADLVNLKSLAIDSCNEMVKVIGDHEDNVFENSQLMFPSLDKLSLRSLPNLVNFCEWRCALELPSLRNIEIDDCHGMKSFTMGSLATPKLESINIRNFDKHKLHNLFPLTMANNGFLLQLIEISRCKSIEEVFFDVNENNGRCHITFSKLEILTLYDLPSLTTFYKGIESIEFPRLREMAIHACPKLTSFATSSGNNPSVAGHSDDSLHLFCNQKVTFGSLQILTIIGYENIGNLWCHHIPPASFFNKLEKLEIRCCGGIRSLFTSSIAADLVNLKKLKIKCCDEMVKVIEDHEENDCENSQLMFPSLEKLNFKYLPNLVNFCGWTCALQLPSLRDIKIYYCDQMKSFTMGSLSTPSLKSIIIDEQEKDVENLNGAVQLYFREKKKKSDEHVQEVLDEEKRGQESNQCDEEEERRKRRRTN